MSEQQQHNETNNNNNDNTKKMSTMTIVEDSPHLRSVARMSATPSSSPFSSSFQSPLLSSSSSSPFELKQQHHQKQPAALLKVPASTAVPSPATVWKPTNLLPIPSYHQLERTHVYIANDVPLDVVSRRIIDAINHESIYAIYDNNEAKLTAETKEGVKFVLRLWQVKDQIVAECQRCCGCGFRYCQAVKVILRAAKTGKISCTSTSKKGVPPCLPVSMPDCIPKQSVEDSKQCAMESLQIACEMLLSDRMDVHLLGIDSLVLLTQASCPYKAYCAKYIFSSEQLMEPIKSLVLCSCMNRKQAQEAFDPSSSRTEAEVLYLNQMHRFALTVLANCFAALEETNELQSIIQNDTDLASDALFHSLVLTVASTCGKPHEAVDACRILEAFCRMSNKKQNDTCCYKTKITNLGTSMYLQQAQKSCFHATLQDASIKLMSELR